MLVVIFLTIFENRFPFGHFILNVLSIHAGHPFVVRHLLVITILTLFESSIINHLCAEVPPSIPFIVRGKPTTPCCFGKTLNRLIDESILKTLLPLLKQKSSISVLP